MKSSLSKRKGSKAFAKLVVNSKSGKVLGVHFVGPEAAEIVQVCSLSQKTLNRQSCNCASDISHPGNQYCSSDRGSESLSSWNALFPTRNRLAFLPFSLHSISCIHTAVVRCSLTPAAGLCSGCQTWTDQRSIGCDSRASPNISRGICYDVQPSKAISGRKIMALWGALIGGRLNLCAESPPDKRTDDCRENHTQQAGVRRPISEMKLPCPLFQALWILSVGLCIYQLFWSFSASGHQYSGCTAHQGLAPQGSATNRTDKLHSLTFERFTVTANFGLPVQQSFDWHGTQFPSILAVSRSMSVIASHIHYLYWLYLAEPIKYCRHSVLFAAIMIYLVFCDVFIEFRASDFF